MHNLLSYTVKLYTKMDFCIFPVSRVQLVMLSRVVAFQIGEGEVRVNEEEDITFVLV